ncbi:MAG: hypothetical protein AAF431_13045 [Pseudomonadota bacterium]
MIHSINHVLLRVGVRVELLVCLALLVGCANHKAPEPNTDAADALRPLLNSERIRQRFGSYGIEVLRDTSQLRISDLYSTDCDKKRTTRTHALVLYTNPISDLIAAEHKQIKSGASLGAVFKQSGWQITKHHRYFGRVDVSTHQAFLQTRMRMSETAELAVHIYELQVHKGQSSLPYAVIAELHHPDYLRLSDLKTLYPHEYHQGTTLNPQTQQILRQLEESLIVALTGIGEPQ